MRDNTRHVPETVERLMESTLDSVDQAEELTAAAGQRAGFDEEELMKMGMAIREAMVNAVVHGNQYNANKRVRFAIAVTRDRFTITIADEGTGFDFSRLPDPLAPENLLRTSGRGIFLMRSFMDAVDLRHLESGGTEVTLVKNVESK
jgi:serine/threonine-protein kinase RsbW